MKETEWSKGVESVNASCPVCKRVFSVSRWRKKDGEMIEINWKRCKCVEKNDN